MVRQRERVKAPTPYRQPSSVPARVQDPTKVSLLALQRAVGNRCMSAVVQRMRIGKIPQQAWLNQYVPAHAAYQALGPGTDVADFPHPRVTAILNANAAHYQGQPVLPAAAPAAGPDPVSDVSQTQLMHAGNARNITPQVDHSVPYSQWGCNDPRNARVLSSAENRAAATPRPPAFDLVALETKHGIAAGTILGLNEVNQELARLNRGHVAGAISDQTIEDIYFEYSLRPAKKRKG